MLLGSEIHVHTDHKNLTHNLSSFTTLCIMRWRLLLEEYSPTFHYKTGSTNFIADALSRVPTAHMERKNPDHAFDRFLISNTQPQDPEDPNDIDAFSCLPIEDRELADCLLEYPVFDEQGRHTFYFATLAHYQNKSPAIRQLVDDDPRQFVLQAFGTIELVCR